MRTYVHLKDLTDRNACEQQVELFKKLFGKRAEITVENLEIAYRKSLLVDWLVDKNLKILAIIEKPAGINTVTPEVGATVRIREDFFICDNPECGVGINEKMFAFAGQTAKVVDHSDWRGAVHIDIDGMRWHWGPGMLEIIK